ncbi:MAG: calcium/sodium antiporter [Lachnospiraceae bacterium]|nr:calcium/sodium antiporter [Lachnospiraceae bacterium]
MLKAILLFIVGLLCLIKGGDWFVDGATGIARKFHLPEILIGATVVSIGTTLPEVMVSTTSALKGIGSIAYGNAIGSIICNTALISAITITVMPSSIDKKSLRIPVIFFFTAFALYAVCAYGFGNFPRSFGFLMLALFAVYMFVNLMQMKKSNAASLKTEDEATEEMTMGKAILLLVAGAALIAVGADLLVDNGTFIAKQLGVPETVIALTFVALGTSLPELVTAITSLMKGHGALSLGNIIGANFFNLVLVCGVSITLAPFRLPSAATFLGGNSSLTLELPTACLVMLLMTVPALISGKLARWQGIALLSIYAVFCIIQFTL